MFFISFLRTLKKSENLNRDKKKGLNNFFKMQIKEKPRIK